MCCVMLCLVVVVAAAAAAFWDHPHYILLSHHVYCTSLYFCNAITAIHTTSCSLTIPAKSTTLPPTLERNHSHLHYIIAEGI